VRQTVRADASRAIRHRHPTRPRAAKITGCHRLGRYPHTAAGPGAPVPDDCAPPAPSARTRVLRAAGRAWGWQTDWCRVSRRIEASAELVFALADFANPPAGRRLGHGARAAPAVRLSRAGDAFVTNMHHGRGQQCTCLGPRLPRLDW